MKVKLADNFYVHFEMLPHIETNEIIEPYYLLRNTVCLQNTLSMVFLISVRIVVVLVTSDLPRIQTDIDISYCYLFLYSLIQMLFVVW